MDSSQSVSAGGSASEQEDIVAVGHSSMPTIPAMANAGSEALSYFANKFDKFAKHNI